MNAKITNGTIRIGANGIGSPITMPIAIDKPASTSTKSVSRMNVLRRLPAIRS